MLFVLIAQKDLNTDNAVGEQMEVLLHFLIFLITNDVKMINCTSREKKR